MKAATPVHLRCPNCRARLRVVIPGLWLFVLAVGAVFLALAIAAIKAWHSLGLPGLYVGIAFYLLVWLIAEIGTAVLFYTFGTYAAKAQRA